MSKKSGSKSKSGRRVLKKIAECWIRDPDTGALIFKPTDKRLFKNAIKKTGKKVVPETGDKVAPVSDTGSVEPVPQPDSPAKD